MVDWVDFGLGVLVVRMRQVLDGLIARSALGKLSVFSVFFAPQPQLPKCSITMPPSFSAPLLARLPALIVGISLCLFGSFSIAQTVPEIEHLLKQGQLPQALEKSTALLSTQPKNAQARFLQGVILTELGRSPEALQVFLKLTEDFPELPEPYNNLAVLYAQNKQYEKARVALQMALRDHPEYAVAHENLGDVYAKLASQSYDKAVQLNAANAAARAKSSAIQNLLDTPAKK